MNENLFLTVYLQPLVQVALFDKYNRTKNRVSTKQQSTKKAFCDELTILHLINCASREQPFIWLDRQLTMG
jgi:hypothetical protein